LIADSMPWHPCDEAPQRAKHPILAEFRTVVFSSRIDHPLNDLAKLSREELARRYPLDRAK
jgi:hypothetical protein